MSDLLSGLRKDIMFGHWPGSTLASARAYNEALDDVSEALRNPTDERRIALQQAIAQRGVGLTLPQLDAVLEAIVDE